MSRPSRVLKLVVCLTCLGGLAQVRAARAQDGGVGFSSLELGPGARAQAMGSAFASVSDDPSASFWNPAGLARLNGLNVIATHNQSFEGIRQQYLSASRKYREGTFSLSFGAVYNSDPLLGTDVNGDSVGTFGYYDLVTTAAFGFRAAPKLDLGVGVEYLNSKIGDFSGSGFALNLGGRWFPGLANLSLGASVRHLGPGLTLENRKSSLPTTVQGGLSYIVPLRTGDLVLAGEVARTRGDSRTHLLLGGEYSQRGLLSLLAGYRSNYDSEAFSFGVGLTLSSVQVHYTYLPFKNDLGSSSRIALSYSPRP